MKSLLASLVVVALLLVAGAFLWTAGAAERRVADAEKTFMTLRYARAVEELRTAARASRMQRMLGDLTGISADAAESGRLASYWQGNYDEFIKTEDPALKMLAADASYRAMRAQGGTWQIVSARLDELAKRYVEILREQPDNEDAAYNYEFVVRLRGAVAGARQAIPALDPAASGLTIHGRPGGPPEGSDQKKFKMIVPMRPDERMEAEEAGRGAQKIRKG